MSENENEDEGGKNDVYAACQARASAFEYLEDLVLDKNQLIKFRMEAAKIILTFGENASK